jgi:hypothetical protein
MEQSVIDASAMKPGNTIAFHALGPNGAENSLQWYLSGPGNLSATGIYTIQDKSVSQSVVTAVDPGSARRTSAVVRFGAASTVSDRSLLLLVLVMGAFGALIGAMRSFVNFVGSRTFAPSWGFYYLSRPVFGAGLALIVFLAYRIGAVTGPQGASSADPFSAAFVSGVVGLFADTFLQKLQELITQLFRPADTRTDKLASSPTLTPTLGRLSISQGTLTIDGTNFATGATVSLNGAVNHATSTTATKITVGLPASAVPGTKLDVIVINPDGAKSAPMSVTV